MTDRKKLYIEFVRDKYIACTYATEKAGLGIRINCALCDLCPHIAAEFMDDNIRYDKALKWLTNVCTNEELFELLL